MEPVGPLDDKTAAESIYAHENSAISQLVQSL